MSAYRTLWLVSLLSLNHALQDCDDVFANFATFSGECSNKWKNLKPLMKPTQSQVGYAWVQYKIENDFEKESDAQDTIDSKSAPVVIGPGPAYYLVDDHHTLCALDYSDFDNVSVTLTVLCDKRNMSEKEFWADMEAQDFVYPASHPAGQPNALPTRIDYSEIPTNFSFNRAYNSFTNDNWRSLAGFSRKVESVSTKTDACDTKNGEDKYCERAFYRGCADGYQQSGVGVSFFEFRWSYFMNNGYFDASLWDSSSDFSTFISVYDKVPADVTFELSEINTDDWLAAAADIVPLRRSKSGRKYEVPRYIFTGDLVLPGYYEGYIKLPGDPSCDVPVCK